MRTTLLPTVAEALPGREPSMLVAERHFVNGAPIKAPFPVGLEQAVFGLGCFWGAERKFWQQPRQDCLIISLITLRIEAPTMPS